MSDASLLDVLPAGGDEGDEALIDALAEQGWAVCTDFLPAACVRELADAARAADRSGQLRPARVGAGTRRRLRSDVRNDRIGWIEPPGAHPGEAALLGRLEGLRASANRLLQLGLFDLECHYALYPPGARYARHLDRFADDDRRALSCVLYLNDAWHQEDGGQLRLHLAGRAPVDILPSGGALVAFLSDRIEHEVLPAQRQRLSVAGWFRRRGPAP